MSLTSLPPSDIARAAASAAKDLATATNDRRCAALDALFKALNDHKDNILVSNQRDVDAAKHATLDGSLSQSVLKRLDLNMPGKFEAMLQSVLEIRNLPDPCKVLLRRLLDDGLILEKISCPIGVLLVIFEARPEVIVNIAALAIKSGNAAILKGGKETTESFIAIAGVISKAISSASLPASSIQLVTSRDDVAYLLAEDQLIDLVIPRGSSALIKHVKEHTRIPVLGHADGLCSIYIHEDADKDVAVRVVVDAKTHYPAACNSVETILVHQGALGNSFASVAAALLAKNVTLRCDSLSKALLTTQIGLHERVVDASDDDYRTEFLDLEVAVKSVPDLESAIRHINQHGSKHTESIITTSRPSAERFLSACDSSGVFWNASTRMADGMRYGFGTEVGISTNKFHARGPVGLEGLMIYKYFLRGQGHIAEDYEVAGARRFKHRDLEIESTGGKEVS